ncbi:MAG: hypothetical protein KDD00_13205 [Ignavibacteriae bacterium]|nr:hypothetical protein [Ignavibacteriota bacterium]
MKNHLTKIFKMISLSILQLIIFVHSTTGQTFQSQEYIYKNNNLKIEIKTKKINYNHGDTVVIKFKLINISKEDIYIFQKPFSNFYSIKDSLCQKLYINYVYKYMSGSEMPQELVILHSEEKKSFNLKITVDSLTSLGFQEKVRIILGLGYIDSFKKIEKFKHMSNKNILIKESKIQLSSIIVDAALRREIIDVFSIILKK